MPMGVFEDDDSFVMDHQIFIDEGLPVIRSRTRRQ